MNNRNAKIFLILIVFLAAMAWYSISANNKSEEEGVTYEEAIENARRYFENEVYLKAYTWYQQAYELNPSYDVAMETAESAKYAGATGDVIDYYTLAMELDATKSEPYVYLMDYYMSIAEYADALSIYNSAKTALTEMPQEMTDIYNEIHGGFIENTTNLTAFYGWHGSYAVAAIEDSFGLVGASGSSAFSFAYEAIGMYNSGTELIPVEKDGEWMYVNLDGSKYSLAIGYDEFGNFGNGYAPVCVDGLWTYVNAEGSCYSNEGKWVLFDDISANGFPTFNWDYAGSFVNNIAAVQKDGKWALIGTDMKLITDYIFDDVIMDEYDFCANGGVIIAKSGDSYHIYSTEGKQVGDASFDDAKSFAATGAAAVCVDGKWGFVNTSGSIIIEPQYDDADSFNAGYAPVVVDGLWGYIDTSGALEIEAVYVDASTFSSSGVAYVLEEDETTYSKITLYEYMD